MSQTHREPLKVGIVGTGFMGENHLRHLLNMSEVTVKGIYDQAHDKAQAMADSYQLKAHSSLDGLLREVDAVVVTVPTTAHYEVVKQAINGSVHVFVEKPFTHTAKEAEDLCRLLKQTSITFQVGHVERFNSVYQQFVKMIDWSALKSIHFARHIPLRKTIDVDIVLAVMVHDLDLLVDAAKRTQSDIETLQAVGSSFITDRSHVTDVDSVFVQSKFSNNILATLSGQRIGADHHRTITAVEMERTLIADLLNQKLTIIKRKDATSYNKTVDEVNCHNINPLQSEIKAFVLACMNQEKPEVTAEDGLRVMRLIDEIQNQMK